MDKKELYKLLAVREAQFEKAKERRAVKTILAFAIVFFMLLCLVDKPEGLELLWAAFASVIVAGIYVVVNAIVFGWLFQQSETERKILEDMRKQLSE